MARETETDEEEKEEKGDSRQMANGDMEWGMEFWS
jgi:hypothetical protein